MSDLPVIQGYILHNAFTNDFYHIVEVINGRPVKYVTMRVEQYEIGAMTCWVSVSEDITYSKEPGAVEDVMEDLSILYGSARDDFMITGKLVKIQAFDVADRLFKVEIYECNCVFFAYLYEERFFRLTPSFPQDENGNPLDCEDARIFIRTSDALTAQSLLEINAKIQNVLESIKRE